MSMRLLQKIAAWAVRMPGSSPSYGAVATGYVAEKLAEQFSVDAAQDIAKIRQATLSKPAADHAQNEAKIASAETKAELDNMKKRAAALRESNALAKRLTAATDPHERMVLLAELKVIRLERLATASERFCEVRDRLRAHGGDTAFDSMNLANLIRDGELIEGRGRATASSQLSEETATRKTLPPSDVDPGETL
ncbi:MAG: hypothetical protein H7Y88_10140 [Phycisphaerales bacterium]|nr:hypothetical protein [Phycisphaerales bacterium]